MEKKLESQVYLKESSCCSQSPPDRKEIIHLRSTLETLMEEENTLLRKNNSLRTEIKSIKLREDVKP